MDSQKTKTLDVRVWTMGHERMLDCPVIDTANFSDPPNKIVEIAETHYPSHSWELVIKEHWLFPFTAICYDKGELEGAVIFCS